MKALGILFVLGSAICLQGTGASKEIVKDDVANVEDKPADFDSEENEDEADRDKADQNEADELDETEADDDDGDDTELENPRNKRVYRSYRRVLGYRRWRYKRRYRLIRRLIDKCKPYCPGSWTRRRNKGLWASRRRQLRIKIGYGYRLRRRFPFGKRTRMLTKRPRTYRRIYRYRN